jgi:ATP-dependent Clp protease protease subunit
MIEFKAKGSTGEIWLYGAVGDGGFFDGPGITDKQFSKELSALGKVNNISLRINSIGGEVFQGLAIYNMLAKHPAQITVDVDGLAGSIASVIAMAASPGNLRMAANAMMMIHRPESGQMGTADDMRQKAAILDQVEGNLAATYVKRTGNTAEAVSQWMRDTTWFTAAEAVQNGFADAITPDQKVTACFDLTQLPERA